MNASPIVRLLLASLMALLALTLSTPAYADPVRNPKLIRFTFNCDGHEFRVVSIRGPNTVLQLEADTGVLIQAKADVTITYTDPETEQPVTITFPTFTSGPAHGQAQGLQGDLITCSGTGTTQDPDLGLVKIIFSGSFILMPRSR